MPSTIEKNCEQALRHVEHELTRLLGIETSLALLSGSLVREKDFIDRLGEDHVVVRLMLEGAGEGKGALAVSQKSAIRMAGKLLMLPVADLNQSIGREEYDEEFRYAYAECIKCFIGAFIHSLQQSSYHCSEVRCGKQEIVKNSDGREILDALRSDQHYFLATVALALAGVEQDDILLLLPACMVVCTSELGRDDVEDARKNGISDRQNDEITAPRENRLADIGEKTVSIWFSELMKVWTREVSRDLSAMFGIDVGLAGKPGQSVNENLMREAAGGDTLLFASYRVDGQVSGVIGVAAFAEDAMRIGSVFAGKGRGDADGAGDLFDTDCEDGFYELCSIILATCAEWLSDKTAELFTVSRERSSLVRSAEEHLTADRFLDDLQYVMTTLKIAGEGNHFGYLHILLPSLFAEQLELITQDIDAGSGRENASPDVRGTFAAIRGGESSTHERVKTGSRVLVVNASEQVTRLLCGALAREKLEYEQVMSTSDVLMKRLAGDFQGIMLAVDKPDEMALSHVIKITSLCDKPLIVAASQWTQSQVVKALRYGAADILVHPVTGRELQDKLNGLRTRLTG